MVKAILFDVDDTLIRTFETKKQALKDLGKKYYDTELTDEVIRIHWGKPIRELLSLVITNISDIEEAFERYVIERQNYPTTAYENTPETLKKLAKTFLLGIITSKSKRYIKTDLDLAKIPDDLFFIIQTDEESKTHKPDPKVFDYTLKQLQKKGIKKSEVLYIGDTLSDYFAARDAGITFFGIPGRTISQEEFEKSGAKTINGISELLFIDKLCP